MDSLSIFDAGSSLGTDVPYGHTLFIFLFFDLGLLGGCFRATNFLYFYLFDWSSWVTNIEDVLLLWVVTFNLTTRWVRRNNICILTSCITLLIVLNVLYLLLRDVFITLMSILILEDLNNSITACIGLFELVKNIIGSLCFTVFPGIIVEV